MKFFALYDNFDSISDKEFVQPFLNRVAPPDEYHIPSKVTHDSFRSDLRFAQSTLTVTGNPAMETWDSVYQQTDKVSAGFSRVGVPDHPSEVIANILKRRLKDSK